MKIKNKIIRKTQKYSISKCLLRHDVVRVFVSFCQSELLGQFRLISDRASDVSGGRICLTQNAYAEL